MKLDIDPFVEEDEEAQDFQEGDSTPTSPPETHSLEQHEPTQEAEQQPAHERGQYACEVKELEQRYNLRGEQVTREVEEKMDPENEEGEMFAMKSFKSFDHLGAFSDGYVEIRSPFITAALCKTIKEYPGVTFGGDQIILRGPQALACVFHYRQDLLDLARSTPNKYEMMHIFLCVRFMEKEYKRNLKTYSISVERASQPSISWADLWMIFRPGDHVVTGSDHNRQVWRFVDMEMSTQKGSKWVLTIEKISHDAISFGFVTEFADVWEFNGTKLISSLSIVPLSFLAARDRIKSLSIDRGKIFTTLTSMNYRSYDGMAKAVGDTVENRHITFDESGLAVDETLSEERMNVSGRIIIDCATFGDAKSQNRVSLSRRKYFSSDGTSDNDYLICDKQVPGFALTEKRWCWFFVDLVLPIQFNTTAFDNLLLQPSQKRLLHALVKNHISGGDAFDDLIKGKGKGLVFALHGDPGVGKTFTVESLADHVQRPLYVLMTGELGLSPMSVEENLHKALSLAMIWDAIVLIDEADVFMEQRSVQDLQRNSLVSIFLRVLEYYRGILFLTTNRLKTIDSAFKSRIHLALKYPPLDSVSRRSLWELFIHRTVNIDEPPSDAMLTRLSAMPLNGRQIKNTIRTANVLAKSENLHINEDHINTVLEIMKSFETDMNEEEEGSLSTTKRQPRRPEKPRHLRSPTRMNGI